jgi:TFIIF-interacting CTD phosphatase-like protein
MYPIHFIVIFVIRTRTHARMKVSEWYKVVVFTASMSEYADPVIDWLDQENRLISKRYFRQVRIVK